MLPKVTTTFLPLHCSFKIHGTQWFDHVLNIVMVSHPGRQAVAGADSVVHTFADDVGAALEDWSAP